MSSGPIPAAVDRQVGAIPSGDATTRLWGELADRPAASPHNYGFYFAATDSEVLYQSDGSMWFAVADIGGGGGGGFVVKDEGSDLTTSAASMDFVGGTVTATAVGDDVTVTVNAAPTNVDYLVGTASGALSGEIVAGPTPGGELGGTWGSPTVDALHAGSTHQSIDDNAFFYALAFG